MHAAQSITNAPRVTLQCVLAEMAGQGDKWAQNELLRVYEPMIRSTSLHMLRGTVSQNFDDMKQLASIAVLQLAERHRIGSGSVFTTFLYNYLGRKIRRCLDDTDALVRIPAMHKIDDRKRLKETGVARFNMAQSVSIDASIITGEEAGGADEFLAHLSPESVHGDIAEMRVDAAKAVKALEHLRPLDRQVVILRLFKDLAFNEIGPIVGRTHQGALNAYLRGMARLRKACGAPQIKDEDVGRCNKKRGPIRRREVTQ